MTAVLYLLGMIVVGDLLARPLAVVGGPAALARPRRLATAILVGFLPLTWLTYLVAYLLRDRPAPLDDANLVTLVVVGTVVAVRLVWWGRRGRVRGALLAPPDRGELLDWALIAGMVAFVGWMMFQTYSFVDGQLRIATLVWSDFGPTTAIAQSFAVGSNFPTEYPHFAGMPILYHFLFYFASGDLSRMGLDPALSLNLLSTATLVSMLVLVMSIGRVLFRSAAVGRLGAILFFVHGSLSWIPYVAGLQSPIDGLTQIWNKTDPLVSGFPYRGEEWGIWTQATFLNQRHLAGAIGVLLVAVLFVMDRYQEWKAESGQAGSSGREAAETPPEAGGAAAAGAGTVPAEFGPAVAEARPGSLPPDAPEWSRHPGFLDRLDSSALTFQDRTSRPLVHIVNGLLDVRLLGFVGVGWLLGGLLMWNSAVFVAAAAVFAVLFLLLPNRAQMVATAIAAGAAALPQLVALRPPGMADAGAYPTVYFGYTVDPPTVAAVAVYLAFTFGPKLLVALPVVAVGTMLQRVVFLAFTSLVVLAFSVQFTTEVFAQHKFLNVWLVVLNLFTAAGLIRLWQIGGTAVPRLLGSIARGAGRLAVVVLAVVIAAGGLIDLMQIKNAGQISVRIQGDPLFDWVQADTKPDDVFLTDLYVTHPILLAGRRIYYGWPYYAWSAGYPVDAREATLREILQATDAAQLLRLLRQEGIAYVAVDDGLRDRGLVPSINEPLMASTLPVAFRDPDNLYQHLVIYRVPG